MADNAIVKIMTALLKHQMKKVVGDETLGVIGQEIAAIGGDKVDEQIKSWLGDKTNAEELENAARYAYDCFQDKVEDHELVQWMVSLPLGNLPKVVAAIEKLPSSPDEKELENALRESVANNWKKLSQDQVNHAINSFLSCLRSALLPIEKQTLMIIGREVLQTGEKVDLLIRWFEQYIIKGVTIPVEELDSGLSDYWNLKHPYPMPPNFTGRLDERKKLVNWLENDNEHPLFILRALGGFGKSALAWHWLKHDVREKDWPKVLWWSFYEGDSSFENFIKETLEYLKVEVPQGQRTQVDELLKALSSQKVLLIMDGFERVLRAYSSMTAAYQSDEEVGDEETSQRDCVNLNTEIFLKNLCALPNIKGKVLMTTRLTPHAVEQRGELLGGCHEVELQAIQKEDAVAFFRAQGIRGARAEIEAACLPYGYHPLSLRIMAGLIANDREIPGDIAVVNKLDITGDVIQDKHHVLEVAYNTLSPDQQKLLSHIACFRSAMTYDALKAISDENFDADLETLEHRGLLHWDKTANKYDLHPIVRHYVYERLSTTERIAIHTQLTNYFKSVPKPKRINKLEELASDIELYHHTIKTGDFDEAKILFKTRIDMPTYYQFAAYELQIELLNGLFPDGKDKPPRLKYEIDQYQILNDIANAYSRNGQPYRAMLLFEAANRSVEKINDKRNLAIGLENIACMAQLHLGFLHKADSNLRRAIELSVQTDDELGNGAYHNELGHLRIYLGEWSKAAQQLEIALELFEAFNEIQPQSSTWSYYALLDLRQINDAYYYSARKAYKSASSNAERALELAKATARKFYPFEFDFVRAHWLLGAAHRGNEQFDLAEQHLSESLTRCRAINNVDHEANIILDLARLRYDQKNYGEAKILAEEALLITERCEYVLQGADVHLFLARFALEQEKDKAKAREMAERAKELAYCDGGEYKYKVAYEEAERFLENL